MSGPLGSAFALPRYRRRPIVTSAIGVLGTSCGTVGGYSVNSAGPVGASRAASRSHTASRSPASKWPSTFISSTAPTRSGSTASARSQPSTVTRSRRSGSAFTIAIKAVRSAGSGSTATISAAGNARAATRPPAPLPAPTSTTGPLSGARPRHTAPTAGPNPRQACGNSTATSSAVRA